MKNFIRKIKRRMRSSLLSAVLEHLTLHFPQPDIATQRLLQIQYRALAAAGGPMPHFSDVGFKALSQADEDGILLYLYALIGTTNKKFVEICAGDGTECNAANLFVNHGWTGLLFEGDERDVQRGKKIYRRNLNTCIYPPRFVNAWITRDKINDLIRDNGIEGEIDLLSIDVDGVDYWLWEAIDVVNPRVVIVEYQDILGPDRAWTVPYADDFDASQYPMTKLMPNYAGASLAAFNKLAQRKGYRLVACNRYGFNAFFLRNDIHAPLVPTIAVHQCFTHPKTLEGMKKRFPTVKDLPWVEV